MQLLNRKIISWYIIVPVYSALIRLHFELTTFKNTVKTETRRSTTKRRTTKIENNLNPCEKWLKNMGILILQSRQWREDMLAVLKYPKDCYEDLFSSASESRPRTSGLKL